MLLHPVGLPVDDDLLATVGGDRLPVGADRVHEQLLRWAAALGLRGGARATEDGAGLRAPGATAR